MNNQNLINILLVALFVVILGSCYNHFLKDDKVADENLAVTQTEAPQTQELEQEQAQESETPDLKAPEVKSKGNIEYSSSILTQLKTQKEVSVAVNPPTAYSGRTQESILNERKNYVSKVFNMPNYKPMESIFGGIASGKPWIGVKGAYCDGWQSTKGRTDGPSEESVFMNNPLGLVMIEMPYYTYSIPSSCSTTAKLLPTKITVSKEAINVYYNLSAYHNNYVRPEGRKYTIYYLKPINAKDFGYEWGYVANSKYVGFSDENSIMDNVYNFLDFIHLGGACQVEGGCNNGSPNQRALEFRPNAFPAYMQIYLWKEHPEHTTSNPDMIVNLYMN